MKKFTSLFLVALMLFLFGSVSFAASAPPLTEMGVYAVYSTDVGEWEYISSGQLSTSNNHGGEILYIVTYEIGYSKNTSRFAYLNSTRLEEVLTENIDLDGDNVIDGYYRYWDASGYSNGTFKYKARSINYPWNEMSASIKIK